MIQNYELTQDGVIKQQTKNNYLYDKEYSDSRYSVFNDRGNILNLNGADWNVTLICELLYQY